MGSLAGASWKAASRARSPADAGSSWTPRETPDPTSSASTHFWLPAQGSGRPRTHQQLPPPGPRSPASRAGGRTRGRASPAHLAGPPRAASAGACEPVLKGVRSRVFRLEDEEVRVSRGHLQCPGGCGRLRRRDGDPLPPSSRWKHPHRVFVFAVTPSLSPERSEPLKLTAHVLSCGCRGGAEGRSWGGAC